MITMAATVMAIAVKSGVALLGSVVQLFVAVTLQLTMIVEWVGW